LFIGTVLTGVWTWYQTKTPGKQPALVQIIVSSLAFIVWVMALPGSPFESLGFDPVIGPLCLIGFTLGVGLIIPRDDLAGGHGRADGTP
jgi:hypothetical protein